jgi:hypothetical protein
MSDAAPLDDASIKKQESLRDAIARQLPHEYARHAEAIGWSLMALADRAIAPRRVVVSTVPEGSELPIEEEFEFPAVAAAIERDAVRQKKMAHAYVSALWKVAWNNLRHVVYTLSSAWVKLAPAADDNSHQDA